VWAQRRSTLGAAVRMAFSSFRMSDGTSTSARMHSRAPFSDSGGKRVSHRERDGSVVLTKMALVVLGVQPRRPHVPLLCQAPMFL
jgi:hypothetical protein